MEHMTRTEPSGYVFNYGSTRDPKGQLADPSTNKSSSPFGNIKPREPEPSPQPYQKKVVEVGNLQSARLRE